MSRLLKIILIVVILALPLLLHPLLVVAPKQNIEIYAGVVPHHLLASNIISKFFESLKMDVPETLIMLSVDHFHQCNSEGVGFITTNSTSFKDLQIEIELIQSLESKFLILKDDSKLSLDHGILDILPFLKVNFPDIRFAPFIVSQSLSLEKAREFTEKIHELSSDKTIVVASVDFSHYLPEEIAKLHDEKSERVLLNFEEEGFSNIEVDSPQVLYIARYFSKLKGADSFTVIGEGNSNDYLEEKQPQTTSYFSVLFGKELKETIPTESSKTFIFTGDIMLDRNVDKLIEEFGYDYPFEGISRILSGMDYVAGNLEGPILYNKRPYVTNSLNFSFNQETAKSLSSAHFNILSLANNHSDNSGAKGLSETRQILKQNSIIPVGDPSYCNDEFIYKENDLLILSFNFTYSFNREAINTVQQTRDKYEDSFIVVLLHWGEEYIETSSPSQKKLAHQLIDAGADLIIGTHPHVVQEIELYHSEMRDKDSIIFYSLGNFIFDQYFSKETQEGLAVGLVQSRENLKFVLIPIDLTNSQPKLMNEKEKANFLQNLAKRSSEEIKEQIKIGMISLIIK